MAITYDEGLKGADTGTGRRLRQADRFDLPPKGKGFQSQLSGVAQVVVALILRETKTRFGQSKLGYIWALLEPAAFVVMFVAIRSAIATATPFGESIVLFMITGLLVLRMFLAISSGVTTSIQANKALLAYPPVKPTDTILARAILETLTMLVVICLFYILLTLTLDYRPIANHAAFAAATGATVLLSVGVGTFNAVVTVLVPAWGRVFSLIRLPLFIMSGVFYVPRSMPPTAQDVLSWNPVLHCVEWTRTGVYLTYDPLLSQTYVLMFGFSALVIGLSLERIYRFRLLAS